jgi:hypothetical protein
MLTPVLLVHSMNPKKKPDRRLQHHIPLHALWAQNAAVFDETFHGRFVASYLVAPVHLLQRKHRKSPRPAANLCHWPKRDRASMLIEPRLESLIDRQPKTNRIPPRKRQINAPARLCIIRWRSIESYVLMALCFPLDESNALSMFNIYPPKHVRIVYPFFYLRKKQSNQKRGVPS